MSALVFSEASVLQGVPVRSVTPRSSVGSSCISHSDANLLHCLQASLAEAEQETLEDAMTTNQERHYMNTAAECKVSAQTVHSFLAEIEHHTNSAGAAFADDSAVELLASTSIHRLGLGIPALTSSAC